MQLQGDIIVITATNTGTWLREKFTPGGWARMFGEGLIGDYREKMQVLREVDDKIFDWSQDLNTIVKDLRRAFKASRLLDVALLIGDLNKKLNDIQFAGSKVKEIAETAIKEFEAGNVNDMVVEAGAWSDFKREWVAKRLENKERKIRNLAIKNVIDKAEYTVRNVQKYVKELGRARAEGNIGQYLLVLRLISDSQRDFSSAFIPVYKKYLNSMVEQALEIKKEEVQEEEQKEEPAPIPEQKIETPAPPKVSPPVTDLGPLEMPNAKPIVPAVIAPSVSPIVTTPPSVSLDRPEPVTQDMPEKVFEESQEEKKEVSESPAKEGPTADPRLGLIENKGTEEEEKEKEEKKDKMPETLHSNKIRAGNHAQFIQHLMKLSEYNNPGLLISAILDYSAALEDSDLNSSLKLLAVAEGFLDESK